MQNFINNSNFVNIRYNRFTSNSSFLPMNFKSFDFKKGLKSIDYKEEKFINKASCETEFGYDAVINMYFSFLNGDYSFLDDFIGDEILNDYKADRLLKIISKVQRTKYSSNDLRKIFKFKYINDAKLHFYIKESRGNLSLLLIDLYHMGIYGENIVNHKVRTIPMEKIYKKYKSNKCMLDDIIKLES